MSKSIQKVVDTIQNYIADEEVLVWHKPYFSASQANAVTQCEYRGINHFVTSIVSAMEGYQSPYWATFRQIQTLGGTLTDAKGKGVPIVFYKELPDRTNDESDDNKRRFAVRHSFVFNFDLVEGVELKVRELADRNIETDANAEAIARAYLAREKMNVSKAATPAYVPSTDTIKMPPIDHFVSQAEFYSTLFHEIGGIASVLPKASVLVAIA